MRERSMKLRVGDLVQVRSQEEILATLDERGCYEQIPFMPQMAALCGRRFRVSSRAHKLCDTVNGTGARRLNDAVFLGDIRCDGKTFGGCEMECLILWKTAWLKRVDAAVGEEGPDSDRRRPHAGLAQLVERAACPPDKQHDAMCPTYSCQATQLPFATTRLSMWDLRQYVEDWTSGNARLSQIVPVLAFFVYNTIATAGLGVGTLMRWAYDCVQAVRGGHPYPGRPGKLPRNSRTPTVNLGVGPGELVRVKTYSQVLETVTEDLINRGMTFHADMVPSCSSTFSVAKRIGRIMNEKTGQVMDLKNPCLILEGVPCKGHFSKPLLCPRGMSPYWREIWLERAGPARCAHARCDKVPALS